MKKIYSILLGAAVLFSSSIASAQQLPNGGFENWKTACGSTEAFGTGGMTSSKTGEMRKRPGVEPADWNGSSINQKVIMQKQETLIFNETAEKVSGSSSVKMQNKFVGVGSIGSVAPGFITLATPWVYAVSTISECDGGAYGGVAFTTKPDAITGKYKRTDATGETSHIIVYLWNGTFTSNVGSKSSPNQSRTNVDRAIWGTETSTGDGKLVAKCDYTFTTTDGAWKEITVPIEYVSGAGAPTMMNTVISGGDYWTRANMKDGTTLYVDDVRFVYYSRLSALSVNGVAVPGFDSKVYNYTMAGTELPTVDQISATVMGQTATKSISIDKEAATVTITVSNVSTDNDGQSSHTYVLQYEKAPAKEGVSTVYPGYLNGDIIDVETNEEMVFAENESKQITITEYEDGTCDFLLPDLYLSLLDMSLGDILVEGATVVKGDDGVATYNGYVENMSLLDGNLFANVTLSGTINANGVVDMLINVDWDGVPIVCTFTTEPVVKKVGVSTEYPGYLNGAIIDVETNEEMVFAENEEKSITITEYEDGTCDFLLPDLYLSLLDMSLGDILVEGATVVKGDDGVATYNGYVENMSLLDGNLFANVTLNGTITSAGVVDMLINVDWDGVPIVCTFTTNKETGVENIEINENIHAVYYNLQGVKVANPENGVFIKVQGGKATKVFVK